MGEKGKRKHGGEKEAWRRKGRTSGMGRYEMSR